MSWVFVARLQWIRKTAGMLLVTATFSVSIRAADLLEVYRLAQANDPTFEAARFALEVVQQRLPQARAGLLPVITATGNEGATQANTSFGNNPAVDRTVRNSAWALQLTQPLLRMQNIYAYSESQARLEQAVAQFKQAEQDLILRVAQAYFDVAVAESNIAVAEAQVRAVGEQLAIATRGFGLGTTAITDTYEAKSRADLARAQQIGSLNELENKRSELEKILGQAPMQLAVLRSSVVAPQPQPADPQAWITQARENNPAVRAQQAAFDAAEAAVHKIESEHLPFLDLTASYGANTSTANLTTPADYATRGRSATIGVQLTIPLYAGGGTQARVMEAIASRYKTRAELEAARRQAGNEARQAYAGVANGLAQTEALDSAVQSGRSAVKGNQVGYKAGLRINIDVLNAEQQLYTSQRDLAKARYDTLFQGLKLKAAAGALSEADVASINLLLTKQTEKNSALTNTQ